MGKVMKVPNTSTRWPDSDEGPFDLHLFFELVGGQLECVGVSLRSETEPVTTSLLRQLKLSSVIDEHRQAIVHHLTSNGQKLDLATGGDENAAETKSGPGRKRLPADHYARVARVYAEAFLAGRNPTAEVAERLQMSRSTAVKQIARARVYDYLEQTEKGKAGGVPDKLAHQVLHVIELDHFDASTKFHDITVSHGKDTEE